MRRLVPYVVLPLALVANVVASAPWLRAFPSRVLLLPLLGAAVLGLLVPFVTARLDRRLWVSALVDVLACVLYTLLVVLRSPFGFGSLVEGIVDGPSQLLSFALPLVSPPTLLVAPVVLCWVAGAVAGECLARRWYTVLPYAGWLITFGLAYAATARAVTSASSGRRYDTLLAGLLLGALLLLRAAQSWLNQDADAEAVETAGRLPARGLVVGGALSLVLALGAALAVQAPTFAGRTATPERVPPLDTAAPLTPVSFVASLRPAMAPERGPALFTVSLDAPSAGYVALGSVDFYDGSDWSFDRTFVPSGGVVLPDPDPLLAPTGAPIVQRYTIADGPLAGTPWLPHVFRPQQVTGTAINIDAGSGMIVSGSVLRTGAAYSVRSVAPVSSFAALPDTALPATSAPPIDTQLPGSLRASLTEVVTTLSAELGVPSTPAVPFLQALAADFVRSYTLIGGPSVTPSPSATPSPRGTPRRAPTRSATPSAGPSAAADARVASRSFADVLSSILGSSRAGSPEQYATLVALLARHLGVPARLSSGFRVTLPPGADSLPAGTYEVRAADAWAWVEIPVRGEGWVVLDAAPKRFSGQRAEPSVGAEPTPRSSSAVPTQQALITQANEGGHAVAPVSEVPRDLSGAGSLAVVILAVLGVVLVLLALLPFLLRALRRRRRRRAADPRLQVVGAWQESLDVLWESGLHDLAPLTSAEVAAATASRFGPRPGALAGQLGATANAAVFSSALVLGPGDGEQAWRGHKELRRLVRRALPVRQRVLSRLSYRRSRRVKRADAPASWADKPE